MATVSIPSGHAITAAEWSLILSFLQPLHVRKTSDESVTSSSTLQDDNELSLTVVASATYEVSSLILYTSGTSEDFKFDFQGPSGAVFDYAVNSGDTTDNDQFTLVNYGSAGLGTAVSTNGDATPSNVHTVYPYGLLRTSVTAGTFKFRFAQNSSGAGTAATCKAGSFLTARRIA